MNGKELFNTLVRLAGLFMLLQAAEALLSLVLMAPMMVAAPNGMAGAAGSLVQQFVISVLAKGCLGYFFLCYAHRLVAFAWTAEEAETRQSGHDSSAT